MSYTAFVIDEISRKQLLQRYKPKFKDVYAHHVTFQMGENTELLNYKPMIVIYGYIMGENIETFLVTVDGKSVRPDGSKYHITWSLDKSKGVKPVDSNKLIKDHEPIILVPCIVKGDMKIC